MMRASCGDRGAFTQIVQLCQDRLYNAIFRMVGDWDEAMELTQETFTRGLNRINQYTGDISPYAWLLRIGMGLCVAALRRSRKHRAFAGAADRADASHQAVAEALGRLETDYRAVLVMRDIDALDYREMGQVLDLSSAALQSRLFRARLALRDEMREQLENGNGQ